MTVYLITTTKFTGEEIEEEREVFSNKRKAYARLTEIPIGMHPKLQVLKFPISKQGIMDALLY